MATQAKQKQGHTPGPWKAHPNFLCTSPLKGAFVDAYDSYGKDIARVADVLSHGGVGSQEVCVANARLIAASPTLFAFVSKRASEGDAEAKETLDSLGLSD